MAPVSEAAARQQLKEGVIALKQDRLDDAVSAFNRGLAIDRFNDLLHYYLAMTYEKKDMAFHAIDHYEKAIQINPAVLRRDHVPGEPVPEAGVLAEGGGDVGAGTVRHERRGGAGPDQGPPPLPPLSQADDLALVRALAGAPDGPWDEFLRRHGDLVHSFTAVVFAPPDVAGEYLRVLERLRADRFALLREFDGRARLSTFLRLKLGDLFAARILKLFGEDTARAWTAFERFFRDDIMRIVLRRFPSAAGQGPGGGQGHEDLYQDVCFLLLEQDYRRIRSFDHRGSFAGYVRRVVRNLCTDLARRAEGRRRVPERILELGALEQDVYRILYWSGAGEAGLRQALKQAGGGPHDPAAIDRAVARVHEAAAGVEVGRRVPTALAWEEGGTGLHEEDLRDERPTPEARLLGAEEERRRQGLLAAVAAAVERLPSECQLYVRMRFYEVPPKAPREIARLIGRTEAEVYRLRDRTIAALRARLANARSGLFAAIRLEG